MNFRTLFNPSVNSTRLNPDIAPSTVFNDYTRDTVSINFSAGTVLEEKYKIVRPLSRSSGEADLYICRHAGKQYVAKIYRRQQAIKPEVATKLRSIRSPYVAPLYAVGTYCGYPYEILPFYRNGSLEGQHLSLVQLKNTIIPCINEALHTLHRHAIIHKDLKPSNIMRLDDGKHVALIDFGISSVAENGDTVILTKTGMTPEYSAPETFRNLFLEESDYYSFGITVYELFCGHTPYNNMSPEDIARFTAIQKIPFPQNMPEELRELISGVTYFDITNRHQKDNPHRRWTYEEVKKWCLNIRQPLPGAGATIISKAPMPEYPLLGKRYHDILTLTAALAEHWNEGKKQLNRGFLSAFFKNFHPEIAGFCMDAEEALRSSKNEDLVFWKLIYQICPELRAFYWNGKSYESLSALGLEMLERLWREDLSDRHDWDSILENKLLSCFLAKNQTADRQLICAIDALENAHSIQRKTAHDVLTNYYLAAYPLSGQRILQIEGQLFRNLHELTVYMQALLDASFERFYQFCHSLISDGDALNPQFEAWLIALGKRQALSDWRKSLLN